MSVRDSFAEAKRALDALRISLGVTPRRRPPQGHPIREKLAKMLTEAGYPPNHLPTSAQGYDRITKSQDDTTVTWDAMCSAHPPFHYHIVSYDTMTTCVRNGFDITPDGPMIWVSAKPRRVRS